MHKIINKHKELVGEWSTWKDEVEYITQIISHINTPEDYTFIIGIHNEPLGDVPKGSIVFSTSDEHSNQPIPNHLQENVFLLFKNYYLKEPVSDNRVFTFPLGYLTGFSGTSSVPFNEREFDYSFS